MATNMKRAMITLLPEWTDILIRLKKEQFYDATFSEMYRVLIGLGIQALQTQNQKTEVQDGKVTSRD